MADVNDHHAKLFAELQCIDGLFVYQGKEGNRVHIDQPTPDGMRQIGHIDLTTIPCTEQPYAHGHIQDRDLPYDTAQKLKQTLETNLGPGMNSVVTDNLH